MYDVLCALKNAKDLIKDIEKLLSRLAALKADLGLDKKGTHIPIKKVLQMSVPNFRVKLGKRNIL